MGEGARQSASPTATPIADALNSPVANRVRGLELDLRLREFEINQVTQRNNFFMIFQGVMIAGLIQSQGVAAPILSFMTSLLGIAVSILQIGMAGGAKYWQSRWESATRSSEMSLILQLVRENHIAVQSFTQDLNLLSPDEQRAIADWNAANPLDRIESSSTYIHERVVADLKGSGKASWRSGLDFWVRKLAVEPKWSVSRIPIWVAAALFLFWTTVWLHTWHFTALQLPAIPWIQIEQLKAEPKIAK